MATMKLDAATLRRLWPHASAELVDAVAAQSAATFDKHKINTPLRVAHFMAQISHESSGGTVTAENLDYSHAARIAAVWPKRFTVESAEPFVHNPRGLANCVYAGRMGNAAAGNDGFNFRGRGLLQITGRDSYRTIGGLCGLDLECSPDLAFHPDHALEVAAAEFVHLGCLPYCDKDDVRIVSRKVNGGYIGLDSRKGWLNRWKLAIPELPGSLPETDDDLHQVAPVDPAPIPRGGDNDVPAPKTAATSSTINSQVVAGGASVATGAGAVIKATTDDPETTLDHARTIKDIIESANDSIDTASTVAEHAPVAIGFGKKMLVFLGQPEVVAVLSLVMLGLIGFTIYERCKKIREDGA